LEYRVYRWHRVTRETSVEVFEAESDAEAISRVQIDRSIKCEIWRGNRVVKRLGVPPPTTARKRP